MGHIINASAFRLGKGKKTSSIWVKKNPKYKFFLIKDLYISRFIKTLFIAYNIPLFSSKHIRSKNTGNDDIFFSPWINNGFVFASCLITRTTTLNIHCLFFDSLLEEIRTKYIRSIKANTYIKFKKYKKRNWANSVFDYFYKSKLTKAKKSNIVKNNQKQRKSKNFYLRLKTYKNFKRSYKHRKRNRLSKNNNKQKKLKIKPIVSIKRKILKKIKSGFSKKYIYKKKNNRYPDNLIQKLRFKYKKYSSKLGLKNKTYKKRFVNRIYLKKIKKKNRYTIMAKKNQKNFFRKALFALKISRKLFTPKSTSVPLRRLKRLKYKKIKFKQNSYIKSFINQKTKVKIIFPQIKIKNKHIREKKNMFDYIYIRKLVKTYPYSLTKIKRKNFIFLIKKNKIFKLLKILLILFQQTTYKWKQQYYFIILLQRLLATINDFPKKINKIKIFKLQNLLSIKELSMKYLNIIFFKKIFKLRYIIFQNASSSIYGAIFSLDQTKTIKLLFSSQHIHNLSASQICNYITIKLGQYLKIFEILQPVIRSLRNAQIIKGFRILIVGRLTRKERAAHIIRQHGRLPLASKKIEIDYASDSKTMRFGAVGVKIWLYTKNITPYSYTISFTYNQG